jgi:predicted transcriptional regulator
MDILAELVVRPSGRTRISRVANLSYDKCVEILTELEVRGLVTRSTQEGHDVYGVTLDGCQIVEDWAKLWRRLNP